MQTVDPNGDPIAGAHIEMFESRWMADGATWRLEDNELVSRPVPDARGTTDASGSLTIEEAPGYFWLVVARAPGRVCSARVVRPRDGGATDLVLCMPVGERLTGVVRDYDGQPLPHALVIAGHPPYTAARDLGATHVAASTDARGRYALEGLPPCDADIWVARPGETGRRSDTVNPTGMATLDLRVVGGGRLNPKHLDLKHTAVVLPRAPELLRGVVTNADGEPISGAYVLRRSVRREAAGYSRDGPGPGVWTLPDGSFVVPRATALEVRATGFTPCIAAVPIDGEATVVLRPARPISVTVRDDTGARVPGAGLALGSPGTTYADGTRDWPPRPLRLLEVRSPVHESRWADPARTR